MIFTTLEFGIFFIIVLALYYVLPWRGQNVMLLIASYFFYGWWDWRFLSLLALSTVIDYWVAKRIGDEADERRRKHLLRFSICANLGILGFFKYFNFFVGSAYDALNSLGLSPNRPFLNIVLPVGISFYTFQTMSYVIDVYRRRMEPSRSLLQFAVYVAYFPQLVAGPIERAVHLLPQFAGPRRVTEEMFSSGVVLMLVGFVRKLAVADFVAPKVNEIFSQADTLGAPTLILGVLLFSLQIYGDFAGYTDIARGTSRMMGIDLMQNFNHPYFSLSVTEFWRRWHISLSTWLRDYLYIPLGGNRGSRLFTYRNLMLTMLLGGLWHGAAWTFVVWGALHGGALIVHKQWMEKIRPRIPPARFAIDRLGGVALAWAITMIFVGLTWVFFRATSFQNAFDLLEGVLTLRRGGEPPWMIALIAIAITLAIDVPQALAKRHEAMLDWWWPVRGFAYACFVLLLLILRPEGEQAFIYFQF